MEFPRASGVLLHPTSLPGRYGMGDLGVEAYQFVDWLYNASQTYWQVLPLGPTSYGDSPYQCLSAFAGNANMISFEWLLRKGWLNDSDLADLPNFPTDTVDFGGVIEYHNRILDVSYQRFMSAADDEQKQAFDDWCAAQSGWLDDYTLFIALKNENGGKAWVEWENEGESLHKAEALTSARQRLVDALALYRYRQWVFYRQWGELKTYANQRGIQIVGDIPIFVAHDSADVWANREYFYLDEKGYPTVIAGVPPDYFSETGQRWGNPLYKWDKLKADNYRWWVDRVRASLALVDLVRIDHFRGFEDYWEIPADEETAINGVWRKGPNIEFFNVLADELGDLPIIAEDLGQITEAVEKLRDSLNLPGMKILQFAWDDPDNDFLPHNYSTSNCIVYTGTHDNNTTVGWWNGEASEGSKRYFSEYVGHEITEPHWDLIRLGMMSVGHTIITPLQDILGLDTDARMNMPGREQRNWGWRFSGDVLQQENLRERLKHLTHVYGRHPHEKQKIRG
jgi:4-alpha-glucanotransferase